MNNGIDNRLFGNLRSDIPASLVVFLVALPLCLGIALASGAPLASGLISGVMGGIVAGLMSKSNLSVSGPAAGLSTVVFAGLQELGTFPLFLCAVIWVGVIQIIFGFLRVGTIGYFVPHAVIKGMLSAIGIILILKQIPHAFGYDRDFEGDESFVQRDGQNTFTEILESADFVSPTAIGISIVSLVIMLVWDRFRSKITWLSYVPAPLVAVVVAIAMNSTLSSLSPGQALSGSHLVSLPQFQGVGSLGSLLTMPQWSGIFDPAVMRIGLVLALIATLESLLSVEAADRLDPYRRTTSLNDELKAQGLANLTAGLVGGLPVTAVIVRTSANIQAGAKTKMSAIIHGVLLAVSVIAFPRVLELIPLACLAGILLVVGYKLVTPAHFSEMYRRGNAQFIPFVATMSAILLSDILVGIGIGLLVSVFFVLKSNYRTAIILVNNENLFMIRFTKDVSFVHKSSLKLALQRIPQGASLIIDESRSQVIDSDIRETIDEFVDQASKRGIRVELKKSIARNGHTVKA